MHFKHTMIRDAVNISHNIYGRDRNKTIWTARLLGSRGIIMPSKMEGGLTHVQFSTCKSCKGSTMPSVKTISLKLLCPTLRMLATVL
jgi:hypothetical protein